jgi:hypothetical protein
MHYSIAMSLRAYRIEPTDSTTFLPRLIGRHGAVASNSYLSANAGADVLKAGGNAIDAAVESLVRILRVGEVVERCRQRRIADELPDLGDG